ncbi:MULTISPECIES: hypothetical protein [unclassified Mesorhizobium]|uniref:hypothetical protein n=1 Tax=unclassified Mesorhizobium TaxID=325217 RepID=UPI0033359E8D
MRTPPLLPAFGKLGVKPPVAIAAAPALSKSTVALRMREILSMHGGLALKLSVVAWTILIMAAAFCMSRA